MAFTKIAAAGIGSTGTVTLENLVVTGSITASLTGTATTTTNIPNLTGAITSNNTTTSLGSFSSANLSAALTDETGSGANVFATSPVLVTPSLGIATAQSLVVSGIITATQLSTGASGTGVNISTDTISGPATLTIDPAAVGDNTGAVRIKGDLYVDGTQFIVNSTTIELADFNVGIASTVGTNALLDGAGIGIGSIGIRKTLTWNNSSTALKSSEDFDISSGKVYRVNGTSVLSNNTLESGVVTSSLTSVGTLGQLQVTGVSTFTNGPILVGTATSTGTASQPLQVTGGAYVSGNLGIGVTSPSYKLDIDNTGGSTATARVVGNDQANVRLRIQNIGSGGRAYEIVGGLNGANNSHLSVYDATAAATRLTITDTGLLGIGTTPVVDLDVAPAASTATFRIHARSNTTPVAAIELVRGTSTTFGADGSGDYRIKNDTGNLSFEYGDTGVTSERLRITSGGLVGIGITSPSSPLHISANSETQLVLNRATTTTGASFLRFTNLGGNYYIGPDSSVGNRGFATGGAPYGLVLSAESAYPIVFGTTNIERARIDSSGRLLIGSTVTNTGALVQIKQDNNLTSSTINVSTAGGLSVESSSNTANYGSGIWFDHGSLRSGIAASRVNTGNWGTDLRFYTHPDSTASQFEIVERMRIDSAGRVTMPSQPAFLAYHQASDLTYTPGQTLSYPFTLYNIGNHYNTSTSTFTAPIAGRYLFSINAQGDYSGSFGGIPRAYWKINGSNVANGIHLRGPDAFDQGLEQRSQTVIFSLSANDAVNMVVGENRWDIFGANFFMGYLVG